MDADASKGNQTILAVIDAQGCCRVLAALRDTAADLFDQVGGDLEDLGFDEDDRPCGTGLHVWQGWVVRGCHGDPEKGEAAPDNDEWEGEWRPATMEDLKRFDFPAPAWAPKDDRFRGLYDKFDVRRTDGSSEPGGRHESCAYFVLDLEHDRFALDALEAYGKACHLEYPKLADDLRHWVAGRRANFFKGSGYREEDPLPAEPEDG